MPPPPSSPNEPIQWPIPKFNLKVENPAHPGVSVFFQHVDPLSALKDAVVSSFKWLYHTLDKAPTNVDCITLILRCMDGVAYTTGGSKDSEKEIHFSLEYIKKTEARSKEEILGVLTHEVVHCYQYNARGTCPGGLIEGFADYVRLRSSLAPPHWKRDGGNHKWDAGYQTTGYFLDWIARSYGEDKLRELNECMKDAEFDEKMFLEILGKMVKDLWDDYCREIGLPPGPPPSRPRNPETNWPEPQLKFRVEDLGHPGAQLFFQHIEPIKALKEAMASTFKWLYKIPELAPNEIDSIVLVLRAMEGVGHISGSSEKEIHISLNQIKRCEKRAKDEIMGVLTHLMVRCWQYTAKGTCPGGLVSGVADYVRLRALLAPPHWKRSVGEKDKWDAGFEKTGYFLDWIGESKVRELYELMKDVEYDEEALFVSACGKTVQVLWKEYCEELEKENGGRSWSVLSWRSRS
ncbi:hypothetical protein AAF712_004239 [Marasmius tenuissimus]|uniref:Plant basic secretory protein n=1 Tax=Marasmius tenuissimus TaxID=585030 RepID=A0ABR3A4U4_9AGAR